MNKTLNEVLNGIKNDKVFKNSEIYVKDSQGLMFNGKAKDLIDMLAFRYVRMLVVDIEVVMGNIHIIVKEVE